MPKAPLPSWLRRTLAIFSALLAFGSAFAQGTAAPVPAAPASGAPAPTPPLGWNSWDSYGLTITEAQFRANVEVLRSKLKPFGWQYAVIDEGWYLSNPEARPTPEKLVYTLDPFGRYVPVPTRFPSAGRGSDVPNRSGAHPAILEQTSFEPLADWVHAQGLKFGIHIVRGIPRAAVERNLPLAGASFSAQDAADQTDACPWDPTNWGVQDNAAGQAWYDALIAQYAGWGVDLLKVDCISAKPYKSSEIQQIRRAIDKSGRPMVLSLSPGPTPLARAGEVASLGNLWRISNDVWDVWDQAGSDFPRSVRSQFPELKAWSNYAQPNHWPDADMLPLGQLRPAPGLGPARASRLTPDEQQTMITLWAVARSPLILGVNLTLLDAATLHLITNRDVLRVNQTALRSAEVLHDGDLIAWRADLPGGGKALALFNTGEAVMTVSRKLVDFGADLGGRSWQVGEAWQGGAAIQASEIFEQLPPHGCALVLLQ